MLRLMNQEWNLSIPMMEIYTLGPVGDITLVSLQASDLITRMLYHGNKKRVHVGNKIKLGMEIPMIESRTSNISRDKGIELNIRIRFTRSQKSSLNMWESVRISRSRC